MIDIVAKRYHWTFEYIVWGVSYVNISMMIADSIEFVKSEEVINADDPRNQERIRRMLE